MITTRRDVIGLRTNSIRRDLDSGGVHVDYVGRLVDHDLKQMRAEFNAFELSSEHNTRWWRVEAASLKGNVIEGGKIKRAAEFEYAELIKSTANKVEEENAIAAEEEYLKNLGAIEKTSEVKKTPDIIKALEAKKNEHAGQLVKGKRGMRSGKGRYSDRSGAFNVGANFQLF